MKQEEKAKRYDELLLKLQKAKVDVNVCDEMYYRVIDDIVPELAKSEDERIRKSIIENLKGNMCRTDGDYDLLNKQITWLEKQGEQKQDPCDNCKDVMLNCHNFPCVKKKAFKQGKSALEVINEEQVDNANKVEPAWSEEDENLLELSFENLTELKDRYGEEYGKVGDCISWLKSLKQRYTWKPSDEQIKALEHFVRSVGESGYAPPYDNNTKLLYSILSDLEKLKGE